MKLVLIILTAITLDAQAARINLKKESTAGVGVQGLIGGTVESTCEHVTTVLLADIAKSTLKTKDDVEVILNDNCAVEGVLISRKARIIYSSTETIESVTAVKKVIGKQI